MNLHIETHGFDPTPAISAWVHQEVAIALDRFDAEIRAIDVYLAARRGPGGGRGLSAAINVFLKRQAPVRITTVHTDLYCAISISAKRAEPAVQRSVHKRRRLQRLELRRLQSNSALTSPA